MKLSYTSCEINDMIDTEEECKTAARYLNDRTYLTDGYKLAFNGSESDPEYPKGCYAVCTGVYNNGVCVFDVFWNTHSLGAAPETTNSKPMCKQGEYIELITLNLLSA